MLRVGLVGCGERGRAFPMAMAKTNNVRLAMVMDIDGQAAQAVGSQHGVAWTTSLDDVLANSQVDAVIICTPHHLHATQAIKAADAGKHVIVEKPLAITLSDARAVAESARKAGVQLSVGFSHRYLPHAEQAKRLIDAGILGDLLGCSLIFQRDGVQSGWRARRESSGGGVLINQLIHYLDWLRYLPGQEVTEISARRAAAESAGEVEDNVCLWFRYQNGALGTVNAALCARGTGAAGDHVEFRFWGRDGHISLTPPYEFYSLRLINNKRPGQWHRFASSGNPADRDVEFLRRFAERVLRGDAPEITGDDGVAVQAIVEAAYQSAVVGHAVRVENGS